MNAIVGISEILLREELSNKQKNYVMNIVNSGNGLLTIINDVLDVSKIESGKFKIVDDEYELESLIYDIVTIMAIKIGDKPIELLVDLDTELPKYIVGDMIRVKQILLNIMGNAVKFTNEGFIRLSISAEMENGKIKLTVCVSDTGIGIQKKDLKDLFASFSQVDTHKNHNIEGTGLGLSISKNLCEMMGGDIQVASEYGKGTAFTMHIMQTITRPEKMIYSSKTSQFHILMLEKSLILREYFAACMDKMNLEYIMCDNDDDFMANVKKGGFTHVFARAETIGIISSQMHEMPIASYVALLGLREQGLVENYKAAVYVPLFALQVASVLYNREKNLQFGRHMGIDVLAIQPMPFVKILLVDDNEVNVQVANGLLTPYYMQVDCAFSGAKAIDMIKENDYDLVFMDHMMPEMDGAEAVKIIRTLPNNKKNVHIVALTANITEGAKEMFVEVGFDDFLAKPIETVKLNVLLKKWLKETNDKRASDNPAKAEEYHKTIMMHQMENAKLSNAAASSCAFVDFANAAKKLGGKKAYCDILSTYSQSLKEKMLKLQGWLSSDIQRFTIEIHGLKGASAGVSANALAQLAAQIEAFASDNNVEKVQDLLPELFVNMQKTLDEVEKYILDNTDENAKENVASIGKPVVHGALSNEALTDIKEAFYNYDSENIKQIIAAQDKLLLDAREAELLENLGKCLNSYDFETPLALIDEYANKIK
ncbi:MAG: ATP-binding protein, partial [Oscillospiraceae bacterium]